MVKRKESPVLADNEDIDSDFSDSEISIQSESESIEETVQNKRLRLAKQYLGKLENEKLRSENDLELKKDPIAHRLEEDVLEEKGKLERRIGKRLCVLENKFTMKGHRLSPTCLAITEDFIFSGSKDGSIIKFGLHTGKKLLSVKHKSEKQILAIAASTDGKLLATGGQDKQVILWDISTMTFLKCLNKHRGPITALAFRRNSHLLISGSTDRSLTLWNCDEMMYIESLYGHQDIVMDMDSFLKERVLTVGGHDKTLRLWKIPEESQLVFNGHKSSNLDCVSMLNEEYFVTGSQDNVLCVWHINKKKPQITKLNAHTPNSWICSVTAIKNSECFISGSNDGVVKVWMCDEEYRNVSVIKELNVPGTVNGICVSCDMSYLVLAVGQEHKNGRWWSDKRARNRIHVYPMSIDSEPCK